MSSKFHIEGDKARLEGQYEVTIHPNWEGDIPGISVIVFLDEENRPTHQTDWTWESVHRDFEQRWYDSKRHS